MGIKKDTGYWIECVPIRKASFLSMEPGFYAATIADFPDMRAYGISPDRAITKLKRRLERLRTERAGPIRDLPRPHNRLQPPHKNREVEGWMSVYLDLIPSNMSTAH